MVVEASESLLFKKRLRLRELTKYHHVIPPCDRCPQESNEPPQGSATSIGFKPLSPCLAVDVQLTALAQLAALRTGCQRSFISVIDFEAQHVIAEATRSVSIYDCNIHDAGDELLIGAQSLPLHFGVCSSTCDAFLGELGPSLDQPTSHANEDVVFVADLRSEGASKHAPIMKHFPPVLRYYVAVPLRSASGFVLGSICAIDSSPRQPQLSHARILQEVARLVMQHLERSRLEEHHQRAELLLSGLTHFVQGQGSMSARSETVSSQRIVPFVQSQQPRLSVSTLASLPGSISRRQSPDFAKAYAATESTGTSVSVGTRPIIFSDTRDDTSKASSTSVSEDIADRGSSLPYDSEQVAVQLARSIDEDTTEVRHTFSRASNLIREAMDLDAAIFLEVPHNDRYQRPTSKRGSFAPFDARSMAQLGVRTSDLRTSTDFPNVSPCDVRSHTDELPDAEARCLRLAYATRSESSLNDGIVPRSFLTISAALLGDLAFHCPQGHVFQFDSSSDNDDDETATFEGRRSSLLLRELRHSLRRTFPRARSLMFLPVFDSDKQQMYAGFIGITNSPTRVLQEHESTYVSAFVNSLMCEIMRLEALKTDNAKSDFMSSISHELRSPLHGILASSQLLAESKILPGQVEYVEMVDTCARTLLDTMDQLLDYAKINHFSQQQTQRRRSCDQTDRPQPVSYSLITSTSILSVIEETIASMAASTNQMLSTNDQTRCPLEPGKVLSVPVILDIIPHDNWRFDTEIGSWRRMIMNVVGNSLKYTRHGYVKVSFELRKLSTTEFLAELNIVDTGQGISEEYLKHRLYTPFAQENNLSVGSGLGLSLVRHIVSSLRGNMRISSEVGIGTEIRIKVPLSVTEDTATQETQDDAEMHMSAMLGTKSFRFAGFNGRPTLSEEPTGIPSVYMETLSTMKDSISNLLNSWFNLRLVTDGADLTVIEESFLEENLQYFDHSDKRLLIIGLRGRRTVLTERVKHAKYICLLPPIGPTRMVAALKSLFREQYMTCSLPSEIPAHSRPSEPALSVLTMTSIDPIAQESAHYEGKEGILLVDDNDINLRILVTCIERLKLKGIKLLTASDGKEAAELYAESVDGGVKISVIFMDISMPVMDGFQATRQIRSYENRRGIARDRKAKIIALTGLASMDALNEVKVSGFDSYLRKPASLKTIREVLATTRI